MQPKAASFYAPAFTFRLSRSSFSAAAHGQLTSRILVVALSETDPCVDGIDRNFDIDLWKLQHFIARKRFHDETLARDGKRFPVLRQAPPETPAKA
jgi:hypothetical protein